ncbi:hypothetical protein Thi970DRAFT_02604 [Thiorhodovibrio frisius]|uniref:Uncharacterized protein n=1 Tax=Thiorhodovibrio frisius TaxID=631362 RepID=H8Z0K7_9GAMM|nr:hypothetical protein Thi970DRAFT_02604 [Thiorhodovibrio frisius]WPL24647.1 hypothetical protein Thiofri_04867 [Thiorhodovibrio frisius]
MSGRLEYRLPTIRSPGGNTTSFKHSILDAVNRKMQATCLIARNCVLVADLVGSD